MRQNKIDKGKTFIAIFHENLVVTGIKQRYLISGNVGRILNILLILEKRYKETVGDMNCTRVTKYSASKFFFV